MYFRQLFTKVLNEQICGVLSSTNARIKFNLQMHGLTLLGLGLNDQRFPILISWASDNCITQGTSSNPHSLLVAEPYGVGFPSAVYPVFQQFSIMPTSFLWCFHAVVTERVTSPANQCPSCRKEKMHWMPHWLPSVVLAIMQFTARRS